MVLRQNERILPQKVEMVENNHKNDKFPFLRKENKLKRYAIPIVILLLLGLVIISQAQPLSIVMSRWSIGAGKVVTGGEYELSSVASQPIVGSQSGEDYQLTWGFWQPLALGDTIYLPIVVWSGP